MEMMPSVFVCCIFASLWLFSVAEDQDFENMESIDTYDFGTDQNAKRDAILNKFKDDKKLKVGKYVNPKARPSKCHVCRVLAQELLHEMNKTKDIKRSYSLTNQLDNRHLVKEKTKIDYKYSEIRITDILEVVCNNVFNYRSVNGPAFPYLRGVKSSVRQALEKAMHESQLSIKLDAPEEVVSDPTNEVRRMFYMCNQMVEEHEDDIMDWYMHKQDDDPIEFVCAERVVDSKEQECLTASTGQVEGEMIPDEFTDKKHMFRYDSNHKEL